jgi:hypothetical protein
MRKGLGKRYLYFDFFDETIMSKRAQTAINIAHDSFITFSPALLETGGVMSWKWLRF